MTSPSPTRLHRLHTDRPIRDRTEDRLGIDPFVRRLVRPLLYADGDESLVVGLYGPWGHGKSSALRLLANALRDLEQLEGAAARSTPQPIVVPFTPWAYWGVEAQIHAFFDTLGEAVGGMELLNADERKSWRRSMAALGKLVAPVINLGAGLVLSSGATGPADAAAVAATTATASAVAGLTQGGMEAAAEALAGEPTLQARRDDAARVLRRLGAQGRPMRVIVLVDDLDRVSTAEEVLNMLRLVKLVADLPNVSYLVAMDRTRVEDLLQRQVSAGYADAFLEKVIQVPVTLPPIAPERLTRILIEDAAVAAREAGLPAEPLAVNWDLPEYAREARFERLLRGSVRTLRDVARILNLYRFALLTADGERRPHLHPVDLLLLCTLQANHATVYEAVRTHRAFLLHEDRALLDVLRAERDAGQVRLERQARLERLAAPRTADPTVSDPATREARDQPPVARPLPGAWTRRPSTGPAQDILVALFPNAVVDQRVDTSRLRDRNDGRICSPERFDAYFALAPAPDEVGRDVVEQVFGALCAAGSDAEGVQRVIEAIRVAGEAQRASVLGQLRDRVAAADDAEARAFGPTLPHLAVAQDVVPWAITTQLVEHTLAHLMGVVGRPGDPALARDLVIAVVDALDDRGGADYAEEFLRSSAAHALDEEGRRQVAAAGLARSRALFAATANVFEALGSQRANNALYDFCRLAERAGAAAAGAGAEGAAAPAELTAYLRALLDREPAALSDVLAFGAEWRGGRPSLEEAADGRARAVLARLLDTEDLDRHVHAMLTSGEGPPRRWPHLLGEWARAAGLVPGPEAPDEATRADGDTDGRAVGP